MCQVRNEPQRESPVVQRAPGARRRPLVLGLVLGVAGLVASLLPGAFGSEQRLGLALLFVARGPLPPPADVAVVGISRDAARAVGQSAELDTWPRDLHARLVERLAASGASTIGFDLMFYEARPGAGDAEFAAAIERAGNVVLLEQTESDSQPAGGGSIAYLEKRKPPLPELKAASLGSAPFVLPRIPIVVGQFWTFGRASDDQPSLPALTVQAHLLGEYDDFVRLVERARPGATARWPQTRAALRELRGLEVAMTDIRRAFAADTALGAAVAGGRGAPGRGGPKPAGRPGEREV